jgi:hypothetical protein
LECLVHEQIEFEGSGHGGEIKVRSFRCPSPDRVFDEFRHVHNFTLTDHLTSNSLMP